MPSQHTHRIAAAVWALSPGYFPFVMATGIISTAAFLFGPSWLSRALLVITCAGLAVVLVALAVQLARFRPRLAAAYRDPGRVFAFFAVAAALNVAGLRLASAGHPLVTAILAAVAAAAWLGLTYGVPVSLLLDRSEDSAVGDINGTWLLWVVATESLAVAAATLVAVWPSQSALLAPAAIGLWSVGLVLYLLLVSLILLRWLSVRLTPQTLAPPYWILMGATAITVLAGARITGLPATLAAVRAAGGFVEGFSFALWAFGTWWIPLLVVLPTWHHTAEGWPLRYGPELWDVVFPLGMYSVATLAFGQVARLGWAGPLSRFVFWAAVAAWVVVAAAGLLAAVRAAAARGTFPARLSRGLPAPGEDDRMATARQPAGTLLSVNVGLPRDVTWQGRTVHTGVWKQAVDGPRMVRRLNIDGDGQGDLAGHGGEQRAVFVYQIESYQFWQEQLGRQDFTYGQFGENFTVRGLADDQVCVGDRYRIGDAVFEVTQPRVTCFRVGIRMNDPRMPALLVSEHRPGFYFRVLTEGTVEAGQDIVKIASGPESMTVAELDALLYLPGHPRQQLLRALRIPALSPGWRASFQEMLDAPGPGGNAGLAETSPPPAWPGFRPLTVTAVSPESDTVTSLTLADPDGHNVPAALPGQFLTLRLRPDAGPAARPVLRSYSLSGPPGARDYRISVKQEPEGTGSRYLHTRVRAGDQLEVAAPRGTFTLRPGSGPVLLISAGVGATPVLAMLHALAAESSAREVWWLHGSRRRADEPFAVECRALLAELPHAHRHVCYSDPGPDDVPGRDYQTAGRLSSSVLAGLDLPRDADAYLCGPPGFMADISAALAAGGVPAARIRSEVFGAGPSLTPGIAAARARTPHPPAGKPGDGPQVAFARSGLTAPWDSGYASLLEFAEACDVPVRWSCRTGVCHTCETALVSGKVAYSPAPVDAPADGDVLICCSQPGDDVVLDL